MNTITRMMKRSLNMPLKKALPLLFVCVIMLACVGTTGCGETATPKPKVGYTERTDDFRTEMVPVKVKIGTTTFEDGTRLEHLTTPEIYHSGNGNNEVNYGGEWFKTFNSDGKLIMEIWKPFFAPEGGITYDPPINDPDPHFHDRAAVLIYGDTEHFPQVSPSPDLSAYHHPPQDSDTTTEQPTAVPWSPAQVTLTPYDASAVEAAIKKADEDARASAAAGVPTYG